jgi:hypothetical protein
MIASCMHADSFAKIGVAGGILAMVFSATVAVYTLWLLQSLYHELKRKQVSVDMII